MLTTQFTLLERLRNPADEQAWVRFVALYTPLMFRWAERQGFQEADAADLIQDVMALLCRKLPEFRYDPNKSFRAWLSTVFLNKCRERWRRPPDPTLSEPAALAEVPEPPSEAEEAEDRARLVRRGLELIRDEFPSTLWQAFWEYAVQGRPPTEVAAELGISPGTVYAAKSRVLSRLRLDLGPFLE